LLPASQIPHVFPDLIRWPEPIAYQFARPEDGEPLLGEAYATAGAGVVTVSGAQAPRPKRTETAQLDPITATQRGRDLPEERRYDDPHLSLGQARVGPGQPRNEFRSGHVIGAPRPVKQKPRRSGRRGSGPAP
jgi:hypothetical protein